MARTIPLTKGYEAIVDDRDFVTLSRRRWHANVSGDGRVYAARRVVRVGKKTIEYMHHVILPLHAGKVTDHLNGNSLDNRRVNLRRVTVSENMRNSVRAMRGGVWRCRQTGRWVARVRLNGKRVFLGRFQSHVDATLAVSAARLAAYGPGHAAGYSGDGSPAGDKP